MPVLVGRISYWLTDHVICYEPFDPKDKEGCLYITVGRNVKVITRGARKYDFINTNPRIRARHYEGTELLADGKHFWLRLKKQDKEKPVTA
jgi:hypothetical protein